MMHACAVLVGLKSENVEKVLVFKAFLKGPPRESILSPGGFEANLGMETSSCSRCLQKSFFENVLLTKGRDHIFIKNAKNKEKRCQQA